MAARGAEKKKPWILGGPPATDTERELDAMRLPEVWAMVTRAWIERRQATPAWRFIVHNVHFANRRGKGLA
jgi:hypothetical protein